LLILPTYVFSTKPGTVNFGWDIAASSDNFSSVACESDEELEHLPRTMPLTIIVEHVSMNWTAMQTFLNFHHEGKDESNLAKLNE